jgi:AAHS family 4-hydroxybenzoate transporter-like MFS transporter
VRSQLNIGDFVDNQPVRFIGLWVFGLCFLAMLSEGYDLGVAGLAAPGIVKTFAISRAQMASVSSAALFGMLVGAMISGFLGDRYGRKRGIWVSCLVIGATCMACAFVTRYTQLLGLRFLSGVGMGALLPNVGALLAEFLPKRVRATLLTFAFMGITSGGLFPGIVSYVVAGSDWRILFFVGGVLPLVVGPLLILFLPESLKFLALQGGNEQTLRTWVARLAPDLDVPPGTQFILKEAGIEDRSMASLFRGKLRWITLALWLAFPCVMLTNFFVNSWLTVALIDSGMSPGNAAIISSFYYAGGICGGLFMGLALDRWGSVVLPMYAILGAVTLPMTGLAGSALVASGICVFFVGFAILGFQVGMSSCAALVYPTDKRSRGTGLAFSIGRLGAMSGPLIAGALMGSHHNALVLFSFPVMPFLAAGISFVFITVWWTGKVWGMGFRQMSRFRALAE